MRRAVLLITLVANLLGGGNVALGEPDPKPQQPEAFLSDWVRGSARFDLYTSFHEWASDTHRPDTEAFEVAVKALALRQTGSARTRSALASKLVLLFRSSNTDKRARLRALHVLGRLAAPEGLDLLVEQSRTRKFEQRIAAIRALGFFGTGPAKESFIVYGGRVRYVVLPPAANAEATRALLSAVDAARAERRTEKSVDARATFRNRMASLSYSIGDALRAHRSRLVMETLLATAADPGALRLDQDDLIDTLALCAHHDGVGPLVRAALERKGTVRYLAAQALGRSARKEAVKPLVTLLADAESAVVAAARAALMNLAGEKTAPAVTDRAFWEKRLGPEGQRFDAARAVRPKEHKPGVYKLGA